MNEPRVAVIVPCFNDGHLLGEALESVAEQEPCELLVVDDGSTDPDTLRVLDELTSRGVRVHHQANAGLAGARIAGVAATRAPYVHPLDADDRLPPGALTRLADALDGDPGLSIAWGHYRTFGASDCLFPSVPSLDPWRITFLCEIPGTSLLRREAILDVDGWRGGVGWEDWDFWMKLAERGHRGIGVNSVTLLYREHGSNRMYAERMAEHARHFGALRERRRDLFAQRRANRRRSDSPRSLKLALTAIEAVPGLPELRKRQLWGLARHLLQPEMSSSCYRGLRARLRERVAAVAARG